MNEIDKEVFVGLIKKADAIDDSRSVNLNIYGLPYSNTEINLINKAIKLILSGDKDLIDLLNSHIEDLSSVGKAQWEENK